MRCEKKCHNLCSQDHLLGLIYFDGQINIVCRYRTDIYIYMPFKKAMGTIMYFYLNIYFFAGSTF